MVNLCYLFHPSVTVCYVIRLKKVVTFKEKQRSLEVEEVVVYLHFEGPYKHNMKAPTKRN